MGLVESTLKTKLIKPLVSPETQKLPSLRIDACVFIDDTFGFSIEITDLAKNTNVYNLLLKNLYSPIENVYTYVGKNHILLSFSKNRLTNKVYCILHIPSLPGPLICDCVNSYDPIGNEDIDQISKLFQIPL